MRRRRNNDVFSEAIVGLFMVAVLALLVYFTIIISGVDVLKGRQKVVANIAFSGVGGLKEHDNVMYRGTKVGGVEDILVTPSNLVVKIEVDKSVVLREGYRISVCSLSMLGGQFLMLEEGDGEIVDITAQTLVGETPSDWMRDMADIAKNLKSLTSSENVNTIITNVEAVSSSAKEIARRLEQGEGMLGRLLAPDDPIYAETTNAVADARRMLANAAEISERIKAGEGTVGKLLSPDADLYADLKDSVASFKKACEQIKLPENMDKDVAEIMTGANKLLANLNEVSEKLKNGEGTIEKRIPAMLRMFGKYGIDIRKEPILVYPTLHYQNGGLDITPDGMTGVENLFAAGEVVGGIHGRNRLMGNSLLDVIVFGRNAGIYASAKAKETVTPEGLTLDHIAKFSEEVKAAGLGAETASPMLLPKYARDVNNSQENR